MSEAEKREALEDFVARWQRAAPRLQEVRDAEIRSAKTPEAMRVFGGSAAWAAVHRPPGASSGLVEQQRWFQQLRARR